MQGTPWLQVPTWSADNRRTPRWIDPRTALFRNGGAEGLSKVRDISPGGVGLSVLQVRPRVGCEVQVDVAFEDTVVPLHGRVVHTTGYPWGSVVGIVLLDDQAASQAFIRDRYNAPG